MSWWNFGSSDDDYSEAPLEINQSLREGTRTESENLSGGTTTIGTQQNQDDVVTNFGEQQQVGEISESFLARNAPPAVDTSTDTTAVKSNEQVTNASTTPPAKTAPIRNIDRRARLRPKPGAENYVYGGPSDIGGLLQMLRATNGMVFPTTPTISESHSVQYSDYSPSHSIAKFNSYKSTDNVNISISGEFNATNATEAEYMLACIHFLRSITKMDFGASSETRGTPPPVLLFTAYGNLMYNDVPVIIKSAKFDLGADVDYIQVPLHGTSADFGRAERDMPDFYRVDSTRVDRVWVPSTMTISLALEQQTTGEWLMNKFDLNSFKRGELLTKGGMI